MKTICGIMNTKWKGEKSEQKKKIKEKNGLSYN